MKTVLIEKLEDFRGLLDQMKDVAQGITDSWNDDDFTEVIAGVDISMCLPCSADEWVQQIDQGIDNINEEIKNQKNSV